MKIVLLFVLCASLIILAVQYTTQTTLFSPQAAPSIPMTKSPTATLHIYGFLPYWNLSQLNPHHAIPHTIVYSGITLDEGGFPLNDPGYSNLHRESFAALQKSLIQNHQQLHLSFTIFSTETIDALLASDTAQLQAIQTILDLVDKHGASGINLDFEPHTTVNSASPELFTQFVAKLNSSLQQQSRTQVITIDIFGKQYPDSLWQLEKLSPITYAFILMAYDYHQRGSSVAGPVAPMFGSGNERWSSDITQSLWQLREKVSHEKIVLGIPFYGYEWRVVSPEQGSQTFPGSGVTATYDRVKKLMDANGIIPNWDTDALSPWLATTTNNQMRQIYFENQQSLVHKVALAQQAHLQGVAIWALGYEGETDDLWQPFANISTSN